MFDDFNGICCRSWNSAGKVTINTPYFGRSINLRKYPKFLFSQMTKEARKGSQGGPPWAQTPPRRGPQSGHTWVGSGDPGPPLTDPLRVYLLHRKPKSGGSSREIFRRLCEAENHEERKALLQTTNLPGKFPPGGGNHRHCHRHQAGLH